MTGPTPLPPDDLSGHRPPSPRIAATLLQFQTRAGGPQAPPKPTHVLVAGHDFRVGPEAFPEDRFDFTAMALRRAAYLLRATPGPEVAALVLDAPSGRTLLFERRGATLLPPVVSQDYGRVGEGERYEPGGVAAQDTGDPVVPTPPRTRRLKDDQFDLLSILDVLDLVYWAGGLAHRSLLELSFFTHATYEGPQLFNSQNRYGHSMGGKPLSWPGTHTPTPHWKRIAAYIPPHAGTAPTTPPTTGPTTAPAFPLFNPIPSSSGPTPPPPGWESSYRDPCDRDGRARYDFGPQFMPEDEPRAFADSFASEGCVRYWGGCVSTLDFDLLLSTRLAKGYRLHGLGPHDALTITPRLPATGRWAQLRLREEGIAVADPRHFEVPFGPWRSLLLRRQWASYPALTAQKLRVPTYAPVPGLWAFPEDGPEGLMHVPPSLVSTGLTELAEEYLYDAPDPEGRGYVVHPRPTH